MINIRAINKQGKHLFLESVSLCIPILLVVAYNLLFYNRYFPLSEGWFSAYLKLMSLGMKPYKDFYFFLPPLYLYLLQAFQFFFGENIYFLKLLGIVIISLITLFCYKLYRLIFPIITAVIITIGSIFYYISNITYIGYDFFHFMTLFSLIGAYFLCLYVQNSQDDSRLLIFSRQAIWLFFSGIFYSLSFLIKQSNGFIILGVSFLVLILIEWNKNRRVHLFKTALIFLLGVSIPISIIIIYLQQQHLLSIFFSQLMGSAQAKGSFAAIIFGWIPRLFSLNSVVMFFIYLITMRLLRFDFHLTIQKNQPSLDPKIIISLWMVFFIACLSIYLPYMNIWLSHVIQSFQPMVIVFNSLVFCGFIGVFFIVMTSGYLLFYKKQQKFSLLFAFAGIALGFSLATGASAAIAEGGIFLGVGLMVGQILNMSCWRKLGNIGLCLLIVLVMFYMTSVKYGVPYSWWLLIQPDVRQATNATQIKNLKGIYFSDYNLEVIKSVNEMIQKYSKPTDTIFTFPNIPLFYFLNDRLPSTFALVHWFDVAPDNIAQADASLILKKPPKIIVFLQPPETVWVAHELGFRLGQPSKQRDIVSIIKELTYFSGRYVLAGQFVMSNNYALKIFRRI